MEMIKRKTIIYFLLIFLIVVFSFGIYRLYDVFYSGYFNIGEYRQIAFLGERQTKLQILLYGFTDLQVLLLSISFSIIFIFALRKRKNN